MRKELKSDLQTNRSERSRPPFHRIGFDNSSIYLTKTIFNDVRGWDSGINFIGTYYLFSWTDWRAKGLLGFELGDRSPKFGEAILIGNYTPVADDIRDVKYSTLNGKAYFKSALAELEQREFVDDAPVKIDAENFMKMKEIIPTGAQGKAIYGEGDYIIDGPAGTGKSTTVLQKIKLLELHENVDPSSIIILVKNSKVVPQFKGLLKSIDIDQVSIMPIKDFFKENYIMSPELSVETLVSLNEVVRTVFKLFFSVFDINSILSVNYKIALNSWVNLLELTQYNNEFTVLGEKFLSEVETVRKNKHETNVTISEKQAELSKSLETFKVKLTAEITEKNKKSMMRRLGKIGFGIFNTDKKLSLDDEKNIRQQVDNFKAKKQKYIDDLKNRAQEEILIVVRSLEEQLDNIKIACEKAISNSQQDLISQEIISLYFKKLFFNKNRFHTIIIDEAQDVSASEIELVRLHAQNTILVGDESQTEKSTGLGSWSKLAVKDTFTDGVALKIFQLRHNFRQTYELGNVSYNYRQLLLNRTVEDIKSDYFDDQIGFNKPSLKLISKDEDFIILVKERIRYINEAFSKAFPLVIFYENMSSLNRFENILRNESFTICIDEKIKSECTILFVNIQEIAGREFPVVLAPLTEATTPNTIYIMLSRANFDLTLFTDIENKIDHYVTNLCNLGLIKS